MEKPPVCLLTFTLFDVKGNEWKYKRFVACWCCFVRVRVCPHDMSNRSSSYYIPAIFFWRNIAIKTPFKESGIVNGFTKGTVCPQKYFCTGCYHHFLFTMPIRKKEIKKKKFRKNTLTLKVIDPRTVFMTCNCWPARNS